MGNTCIKDKNTEKNVQAFIRLNTKDLPKLSHPLTPTNVKIDSRQHDFVNNNNNNEDTNIHPDYNDDVKGDADRRSSEVSVLRLPLEEPTFKPIHANPKFDIDSISSTTPSVSSLLIESSNSPPVNQGLKRHSFQGRNSIKTKNPTIVQAKSKSVHGLSTQKRFETKVPTFKRVTRNTTSKNNKNVLSLNNDNNNNKKIHSRNNHDDFILPKNKVTPKKTPHINRLFDEKIETVKEKRRRWNSNRNMHRKERTLDRRLGNRREGFVNLQSIKSASNSVDSQISNFEKRTKVEKFNDKRATLKSSGLGRLDNLINSFKSIRLDNLNDAKRIYTEAIQDLQNQDWEIQHKGIDKLVAVVRQFPELIDAKIVSRLMLSALHNLRSQVCRSAAQGFGELFIHDGRNMEIECEKIISSLLNKAADTSKFIREDSNMALDAAVENLSVYRVLNAILEAGSRHRNVVVRANVARILSNVVNALGAERVMGTSKEFQTLIFDHGCNFLSDGSLEVRTYTKQMFKELMTHKNFSSTLKALVSENEIRKVQKNLDSIQASLILTSPL